MRIKRQMQVSTRHIETGLEDRVKMDICQAAAMEYYDKRKDQIKLDKVVENKNFTTFGFEFVMMDKEELRETIQAFHDKLLLQKGIGLEKVDAATQILVELLVVNQ